ncbi:MAG: hypothetical protein N2595_07680 [bacterium]|nr:hypothetical protein [bacterium]
MIEGNTAGFEHVFPGRHVLWYWLGDREPVYYVCEVRDGDVEDELRIGDGVVVRGRVRGEDLPGELGVEVSMGGMDAYVGMASVAVDEDERFDARGVAREARVRLYDGRDGRNWVVVRAVDG